MRIILTPEDSTTEHRWTNETPYLAEMFDRFVGELSRSSIVLDYGCGIGRLAKEIIARHGCRVIGVDISPTMRALSIIYVDDDRFFACAPEMLDTLSERDVIVDAAISVWVLQHCQSPAIDIARIRRALRKGKSFFVVNNLSRAVPTKERGWFNDGINIRDLLQTEFSAREEGRLDPVRTTPMACQCAFWAAYGARD
jgi:SAM-dependent methyltransferase